MKKLGVRQIDKAMAAVVAFVNEKSDLEFNPATQDGSDGVSSALTVDDTPVGKVYFNLRMGPLGMFLHIRVSEVANFTPRVNRAYNVYSGKYNCHIHRSEHATLDSFITDCMMMAEDYIRDVMDHDKRMAAYATVA